MAERDQQGPGSQRRRTGSTASSVVASKTPSVTPSQLSTLAQFDPGTQHCLVVLTGEVKTRLTDALGGFSQQTAYALQAYEMSGCQLGLVVVGTKFSRMRVLDARSIALEVPFDQVPRRELESSGKHGKTRGRWTEGRTMGYRDVVRRTMAKLLAHDLGPHISPDVAEGRVLVDYIRQAAELMLDINLTQPFTRLPDLAIELPHLEAELRCDKRWEFAGDKALDELLAKARAELTPMVNAKWGAGTGLGGGDEDEDENDGREDKDGDRDGGEGGEGEDVLREDPGSGERDGGGVGGRGVSPGGLGAGGNRDGASRNRNSDGGTQRRGAGGSSHHDHAPGTGQGQGDGDGAGTGDQSESFETICDGISEP